MLKRLIFLSILFNLGPALKAQWLVRGAFYNHINSSIGLIGENYYLNLEQDSLLSFTCTSSEHWTVPTDLYATYGTVSKRTGQTLSCKEVPVLNPNYQIYWSLLPKIARPHQTGFASGQNVNQFGQTISNHFGAFDLQNNAIKWSIRSRVGLLSDPVIRASDTIIWTITDLQSAFKNYYLLAFNIHSGDTISRIPLNHFIPENRDTNYLEFEISRYTQKGDSLFIEFQSINPNSFASHGYTAAKKWVKCYHSAYLDQAALDSVFFDTHNLDEDFLSVFGQSTDLLFYRYHDSIPAFGDSGIKTIEILNWKGLKKGSVSFKSKIVKNPHTGEPFPLYGAPFSENNYILIHAPVYYQGPQIWETATRITLFDPQFQLVYDILSDTLKRSFQCERYRIDKNGVVYFQAAEGDNLNFLARGKISTKGEHPSFNSLRLDRPTTPQLKFVLGPNPSTGYLWYQSNLEVLDIRAYDSFGRQINFEREPYSLKLNPTTGLYYLYFYFENGASRVEKVLLKRED